jgi:Kef-type K+ transport system membrane component KefB
MDKTVRNISVSAAVVVGAISWALVSFIPAFKSGIPVDVANAIPVIVALIAHYLGFNFASAVKAREAKTA